jgi:exodeoxyribonuclease I
MANTFFFYDLETTGLDARNDRVMQFAGIRTDADFEPIGQPYNVLVRLNDDVLPSPEALMVTGITPQQTVEGGMTEAEFAKLLIDEIFVPDTTAVGFNNIRFDDEFIRHLLWRNFHDPYEWSWKDGRSRWDMLDVVRMTRALRPEGIIWPVDAKMQPTNKLELIASLNGIDHIKAHDALSDVEALIGVARLIRSKQPQLFDYLLKMRDKKEVKKLVNLDDKKPFVYVSGRYGSTYNKSTIAVPLTQGRNGNVVVYDLRYDPADFVDMSQSAIEETMRAPWADRQKIGYKPIPVKELQYNRAPAVAPLGVLNQSDGWKRIGISEEQVAKNMSALFRSPSFAENMRTIFETIPDYPPSADPESRLYDGFLSDIDKMRVDTVRQADESTLADFHPSFIDDRLDELLLHYKARNYPKSLAEDEAVAWEKWRSAKIMSAMPVFIKSLKKLSTTIDDENKQFILQELQLWAESVMPIEDDSQQSLDF